jgi:glycosyltransferase involved in cell wall biosynthesis
MSDERVIFDVIIPTYNHARLLREALASVTAQTLGNWRAFIINNHSTDDTADVIASFNDSRMNRIDFANHGVIGASRNVGINAGDAPFVAFLDSDDVWYPNKLEVARQKLTNEVDVFCHAERWVELDGTSRVVEYGHRRKISFGSLLYRGNSLSTSAVIMRRSLLNQIGGFDTDAAVVTAEDYELWLRAAHTGARFALTATALGEFRRQPESASSRVDKNAAAERAVLAKHFPKTPNITQKLLIRRRMALSHYGAARGFQHAGDSAKFWTSIRCSLSTFPFLLRPYAAIVLAIKSRRQNGKSPS